MESNYKYFAFISYNSKDTAWGKRLQRKLENYRLPAAMCSERGWKRTPIRPVFFAPTDIQPGGLSEELQERLKASKNLIVICSPNSAKSDWVGKEIEFFHNLGRTDNIHFFIVDGKPNSGDPETECFHPVVNKLGLPEILGANINEKNYSISLLNRERAYVQLVSKLLDVEFDSIWQRHKRRLVAKVLGWTLGLIAVLSVIAGVWIYNQPIETALHLNEASAPNQELPPLHDAIVTLELANESKQDTITSIDGKAIFSNIPHNYLKKPVHVTVTCPDFLPVDTTLEMARDMTINVYRDPAVYGNVHFDLWNPETETFIPNAKLEIAGITATSDRNGHVEIFIPLEKQRKSYQVKAQFPLYNDILTMPSGENDVIEKL